MRRPCHTCQNAYSLRILVPHRENKKTMLQDAFTGPTLMETSPLPSLLPYINNHTHTIHSLLQPRFTLQTLNSPILSSLSSLYFTLSHLHLQPTTITNS